MHCLLLSFYSVNITKIFKVVFLKTLFFGDVQMFEVDFYCIGLILVL
jgi:hypothetical protein